MHRYARDAPTSGHDAGTAHDEKKLIKLAMTPPPGPRGLLLVDHGRGAHVILARTIAGSSGASCEAAFTASEYLKTLPRIVRLIHCTP